MTDRIPMNAKPMSLVEARSRMNPIPAPDFWVGSWQEHIGCMEMIHTADVAEIGRSPRGRPLHVVTYSDNDSAHQRANYNSACAGGQPQAYRDKARRKCPVVLLVGPVHGHEVEGLTGIHNLIHILETGTDFRGQEWPRLAAAAAQCSVVLIPCGNPDGLVRFEPDSLVGAELCDLRFWGQGTHADGRFWNWPECKRQHPMAGQDIEFLGCYFNDKGINPMHDEFFDPMGPEAPAILRIARLWAPDWAALLHSHSLPPTILQTRWIPLEMKEQIASWSRQFADCLKESGFEAGAFAESSPDTGSLNLTAAMHHVCGAVSVTYESPHGLADGYQLDHDGILDTQLLFFQSTFEAALKSFTEARRDS